jgi:hypothetical protein
MTIEINRPELEALIRERMNTGAFQSVEEALLQALRDSPLPDEGSTAAKRTGVDLIAAIQPSPYRELEIDTPQPRKNLADFLLDSPFAKSDLNLERKQDYGRPVDL